MPAIFMNASERLFYICKIIIKFLYIEKNKEYQQNKKFTDDKI